MIEIDKELMDKLFAEAMASERKRMNYDLRTSSEDSSQRMLNALLPGTEVAIHRHPRSTESIICISGDLDVVLFEASPKSSPKGKDEASLCLSPEGKSIDLGIHTADPMWYGMLKDFAEENRNNPTEAESALWNALKGKGIGFKFRQQHIIEDFIVDFYCNDKKLTIELDGGYHNAPEQMKSDEERTARLKELGYTEIRFTNEQVLCDFDNTLAEIERVCKSIASHKSSPVPLAPELCEEGKDSTPSLLGEGWGEALKEKERIHLCPDFLTYGCVVPKDTWHTVEVHLPSLIFEAKDGKYGEDGSESWGCSNDKKEQTSSVPDNCIGDLKQQITYLIGMERHSGSMDNCSPLYVSRMLNVSLEEVEAAMKEMGM